MPLPEELEKLARETPEIQEVLAAYAELEHVYKESIEAMSGEQPHPAVASSAEVTLSFSDHSASYA